MSDTSGSADARTERNRGRLARERLRAERLERQLAREKRRRSLTEALAFDWVGAYADYLDRVRDREPVAPGMTTYWHRRRGQNYPIFQTEAELNLLRAPARVLCATNGYAIGLLEGLTSYVIGPGFTYRAVARDDAEDPPGLAASCQRVVDELLERSEWYGGEQPGLEEELFWRSCEDGEFLLVHFPRSDGRLDVRTAEPEQLTAPPGGDDREWRFGVRTPPDDAQNHLAYYLQWGESPADGEEYSPDRVTFYRRNSKRSIKRGVTDFCWTTYDALWLADQLRTALGDAAAQQAAIVGVRQHQFAAKPEIQQFVEADADFDQADPATGRQTPTRKVRRGSWEDIPEGLAYVQGPGATNAPAHLQVLDALLRNAGQRWQAPAWLMSGDVNAMNYATSLTAESPFVRTVIRRQRGYREAFRRTMLVALEVAAEAGLIVDDAGNVWRWKALKRVIDVLCEAPGPETRNKLEETQRAAIEIPLGLDSRQQYVQRQGRDWDQVEADNRAFQESDGGGGPPLPDAGGGGGGADVRTPPPGGDFHPAFGPIGDEVLRALGVAGRGLTEAKDAHGHGSNKGGESHPDYAGDAGDHPAAKTAVGRITARAGAIASAVSQKLAGVDPADVLDTADDWMAHFSAAHANLVGDTLGVSPYSAALILSHVAAHAVQAVKAKLAGG